MLVFLNNFNKIVFILFLFLNLSIYLMRSQQVLVVVLLIALTQTKLIDHEQVASGFACCP